MTEQLTLDGKPAVKLTERQQYALDIITDLGPVPSDELGAHMHERRGKHTSDLRCRYCGDEGKDIAKELRKKKLVRMRRGEGWYVVGARPKVEGYDPSTAPLPEGF